MIFLMDENISPHAARMLGHFDRKNEIRALEDHFEKGTPDVVWLTEVATWDSKPVIVGGDGRILKNPAERAALRSADLMFVYLASGWTKLPWEEQAWKIVKVWPAIVQNVVKTRHPTVFEVSVRSLKVDRFKLVADIPDS